MRIAKHLRYGFQALRAELMLGWRRALRGPLVVALGVSFVLLLFVLPAGAEEAEARLGYAMGLAWTLLLVCALWCGVGSYALDRERRRMTLTMTKPLSRWALWVGRWLGTSLPFMALLVLFYGMLLGCSFPQGDHRVQPLFEPVQEVAKAELAAMRAEGLDTLRVKEEKGVSEARLLDDIERHILSRYTELTEDAPLVYTFAPLPQGTQAAVFCLSGVPFMGAYNAQMMEVQARLEGEVLSLPVMITSRGVEASLPAAWVHDGKQPLTIALVRKASFDEAGYILFREREDIQLFTSGYAPWLNTLLAVAVMAVVVLMASALGCALGALFSLPVGLFVGSLCFLVAAVAAMDVTVTVTQELQSVWTMIGARVSDVVAGPFRGIVALDPLTHLSEGIAIEAQALGRFVVRSLLPWVLIASLGSVLTSVKDVDP
jgi:ABC-type multidrug transport system fused ATPase/permease subunit